MKSDGKTERNMASVTMKRLKISTSWQPINESGVISNRNTVEINMWRINRKKERKSENDNEEWHENNGK